MRSVYSKQRTPQTVDKQKKRERAVLLKVNFTIRTTVRVSEFTVTRLGIPLLICGNKARLQERRGSSD